VVSESGLSSGFRYCLLSGHCGVALFHCCLCCITGCSPIYMNSKPDFYVADSLMNPYGICCDRLILGISQFTAEMLPDFH